MQEMYTPRDAEALRGKAGKAGRAAIILGALALVGCVALCLGIRTRNAPSRQAAAIALSALAGWAVLWMLEGVRTPALREAAHEEGVLREKAERHEGVIRPLGDRMVIPRSIAFVPVTLEEAEGEAALKLNARFRKVFPAAGTRVRVETRRGYITGWETEEETAAREKGGEGQKGEKGGLNSRKMGKLLFRRKQLTRMAGHGLLVLLGAALLWSWIFTSFLTDTEAGQKVVLYANMRQMQSRELAIRMEEAAPEGIRFAQARPFSYALMDSDALRNADLYIMTAAQAEEYREWIAPPPAAVAEKAGEGDVLAVSGLEEEDPEKETAAGIRIYDGAAGEGAMAELLSYGDRPGEDWYLFFGRHSVHTGEKDDAAIVIAELFF